MYSVTIGHVKHAVGSLAIAISLVLLLQGSALAVSGSNVKKKDFFDWNYAVSAWQTLRTVDDLEREYAPLEAPYKDWQKAYKRDPQAALEALKKHPDRELIRKGHDLSLVYETWRYMYSAGRSEPWNQRKENGWGCMVIRDVNIYTRECNDMPDWRTDKGRAEDEARQARMKPKAN